MMIKVAKVVIELICLTILYDDTFAALAVYGINLALHALQHGGR